MRTIVLFNTSERGVALVIAIMATTLMLTLGGALVLLSSSETVIAGNFRTAHEATYAADAAIERSLADLRGESDWTPALAGGMQSAFVDGPPSGRRTLADGSTIDLDQITYLANCQKATPCSAAELGATTPERPWGANNPQWTLYAYGPLANLLDAPPVRSAFYVVAFVGDDPSENDGDPTRDGVSSMGNSNPGKGIAVIRAEAFGPKNAHTVIEATIALRVPPPSAPGDQTSTELRVLSWTEVR